MYVKFPAAHPLFYRTDDRNDTIVHKIEARDTANEQMNWDERRVERRLPTSWLQSDINYKKNYHMVPCHIHLLLPINSEDVDGPTTVEFIYDVLNEGFHMLDDKVQIEYDHSPNYRTQNKCVSVVYENTWRCQIHFNDDKEQVLQDSQLWSRIYGIRLPLASRKNIAGCYRRLDISCDPDVKGDYSCDFDALLLYLRHTFGQCYTFDSLNNKFIHNDTE